MICYAKNVENHAIFVEGFWPGFYARGRFMKYSMSGLMLPNWVALQSVPVQVVDFE